MEYAGSSAALTSQAVSWTSVKNCTVSGSNLEKTSGVGWAEDAGAVSVQRVSSGTASVQFRIAETTAFRFLGLSSSSTWNGAAGMDFAFRLQAGAGDVYENNQWRHAGSIATGDVLKITAAGGGVRYYRNGTLVYTSTKAPTYPLAVHASFIDMHGTVKDVVLTTDDVGAAPPVEYGWQPPPQTVGGGATVWTVPAGYIHQTAWSQNGGPDIRGVYAKPNSGWQSMVWRWADTMRSNSIQHVTGPGGDPAYRVELAPTDGPSPGTSGNNPRAELFSVDPAEKRRTRPAPVGSVLRDGDEYWVTFALYIPTNFPTNHRWATLFQRKIQDTSRSPSWFTLNVHGTTLDVSVPGNTPDVFMPISTLSEVAGHWVQFTGHEKLSSGSGGLAEFYVNGARKMSVSGKPTVPSGDINFHFQYGYYRANKPQGPGVGVLYYTPMLIKRGASQGIVPALP
jgi:hypothetical protein